MLRDVVEVKALGGYQLFVRFEDGVQGVVDVAKLVSFKGVFAPLKDVREFQQAAVNPELGAVQWPSGADLDPDVLYAHLSGQPIEIGLQRSIR
jgi:hypothetical protein